MKKFLKKFALTGNSDGSTDNNNKESEKNPSNVDKGQKPVTPIEKKATPNNKPNNPNQPPKSPQGNGGQPAEKKKASGSRILLYVLLGLFFGMLLWALFFTTPSYVVNSSDFISLDGGYSTITYSKEYTTGTEEYILEETYKDGNYSKTGEYSSVAESDTPLDVTQNLDSDGNGTNATISSTDTLVSTEVISQDTVYTVTRTSTLFKTIDWSETSSALYLDDDGGNAQLRIEARLHSGERENYTIYFSDNTYAQFYVSALNDQIKPDRQIPIQAPAQPSWFWTFILTWLPWLLFFVLGMWIVRKMMEKQSGQMNFGKSTAKMTITDKKFEDVAGYTEIKEELVEIVDFLKDPIKYSIAGARSPKGILITGPPGTGKTLMAKAVAGEAGIPFFSISGSDFVEMFVGVGASRVRSMFKSAKEKSPCLIFIDELDAVGRQRGAGVGGGNDEREQTLNQLLVEMDGFSANSGIVVMGATNRPDVLDPALKRPGRFDREVSMRLPDVRERELILRVHLKGKKIADDLDVTEVAERTPGFSGAQLENVVNEATILSIRHKQTEINKELIDEAVDRVIAGPAKTDNIISKEEKELIAFHESGHAIIGLKLKGANIVRKITIVPRGDAGGYVLMTPKREKFVTAKFELEARITSYMAGRAAEQLFFGKESITTGAYADIQSGTEIARQMVTEYGMSSLGPIQYEQREGSVFLGRQVSEHKKFSDHTSAKIDKEVEDIIEKCFKLAQKIVKENQNTIKIIADSLMIKETLTSEEITYIEKNKKMPSSVIDYEKRKKEEHKKAEAARKKKLVEEKKKLEAEKKKLSEEKKKIEQEKKASQSSTQETKKTENSKATKPKIVDVEKSEKNNKNKK